LATEVERFYSKVDKRGDGDCWPWQAAKNAQGYGRFSVYVDHCQRWFSAHRVAWEWTFGAIPPGIIVCHRCDNPSCVNPTHLFLGTHKDNARDRDQKRRRRAPAGELNGRAKLTASDVDNIRMSPHKAALLAELYGVARQTICAARSGQTWRAA